MSDPIAGGVSSKIAHGSVLPENAAPFTVFILTSDELHPQLCICTSEGTWVTCALE
jgi:hypothetical protein